MAWTYIMFFFQEWVFPAFTYHWYPFLSFLFLFRKTVPFHCHYMTSLFYFDCVTLIIVAWENAAVIVLSHPFVWKQKQTKRFIKKYKNSQLNQYQTISFCNNLRLNWSNWSYNINTLNISHSYSQEVWSYLSINFAKYSFPSIQKQ